MTDGIRLDLATATTSLAPSEASSASTSASNPSAFRDALRDAARAMGQREARIDHVLAGHTPLSPEQLLALQATVHRHSQEVELASKLVDKLTGAVKQVLTSQQ